MVVLSIVSISAMAARTTSLTVLRPVALEVAFLISCFLLFEMEELLLSLLVLSIDHQQVVGKLDRRPDQWPVAVVVIVVVVVPTLL
jgi:hypothetical protein